MMTMIYMFHICLKKKLKKDLFILTTTKLVFQYLNSEHALHFPVIMVSAKYFCCDVFILLSQQLSRDKEGLCPFNRRLRPALVGISKII